MSECIYYGGPTDALSIDLQLAAFSLDPCCANEWCRDQAITEAKQALKMAKAQVRRRRDGYQFALDSIATSKALKTLCVGIILAQRIEGIEPADEIHWGRLFYHSSCLEHDLLQRLPEQYVGLRTEKIPYLGEQYGYVIKQPIPAEILKEAFDGVTSIEDRPADEALM